MGAQMHPRRFTRGALCRQTQCGVMEYAKVHALGSALHLLLLVKIVLAACFLFLLASRIQSILRLTSQAPCKGMEDMGTQSMRTMVSISGTWKCETVTTSKTWD